MARQDSRHRGPEESRDAKHALTELRWTDHVKECLTSQFQRKFYMENYRRESAIKVVRRNATKTSSKPLWRILTYQWGLGNRLHRNDRSGEVSSTKEQLSMKERESVKLKESAENAKP